MTKPKAMRKTPRDVQRPNTRAWARQQGLQQQQRELQYTRQHGTAKQTTGFKSSQRPRAHSSQDLEVKATEMTAAQMNPRSKPSQRPRRPRHKPAAPARVENNRVDAEKVPLELQDLVHPQQMSALHVGTFSTITNLGALAWLDQLPNSWFEDPDEPPSSRSVATDGSQAVSTIPIVNTSSAGMGSGSKATLTSRAALNPYYLMRRGIVLEEEKDCAVYGIRDRLRRVPSFVEEESENLRSLCNTYAKEANNIESGPSATQEQKKVDFSRNYINDYTGLYKGSHCIPTAKRWAAFLDVSRRSNEFILQRTLMMSLFDPMHLDPSLDFNCEALMWSTNADLALPCASSGATDDPTPIIHLRPNLVFSFKPAYFRSSKCHSLPPPRLESFLGVEGLVDEMDSKRCFPFLLVEAKGSGEETKSAQRANLYSASRALYSVYQWMKATQGLERFFKKVRVFSLVFNTEYYSMRVHRAENTLAQTEGLEIHYLFDTISQGSIESNIALPILVHNVLHDYGVQVLGPILKDTYEKIVYSSTLSIPGGGPVSEPWDDSQEAVPAGTLTGNDLFL